MENTEILITQKDFNKLKNEVKKAKEEKKKIIYYSKDDELNRKVIEKLDISVLLISQKGRKDFQKQRNSGFNQVIAKIMEKRNIALGIDLDEIIEEKNQTKKAEIIARVEQNIFICKKNNVKMIFIVQDDKNKRDLYDLKSLGLILSMPNWMTKQF